ncbi:MAG: hypothetical protein JW880_00040 [Candidatus Thermoplasmatota archaeon]|nr:hypothetical protein [Candidatus Thermoplasmatota archaeon]
MAGNYLKSLQLAKQLEERAKEASKNKELAERENEALEQFLKACYENDVDLSGVEATRRDFEAAMLAKDYQSALAHARRAREAANDAYIKRIGDVADSVEALLSLLESSETEPKGAHDYLDRSRERVVAEDLEGAMKFAKNAYDAAERQLHEFLSQLFSQAQEVMIQAKEMGEDVSIFEDQLMRAKNALQSQDYEACMMQVKDVLESAGEEVKAQIGGTISRVEELISAGEDLSADLTRVKNHLEKSKGSLGSLKFKESLAYAKRAESEGENAISSRFQEMARDVRESIKKMKSAKEDVTIPQQLLDQALGALKDKRYIEALHALNTAHEKVHQAEFNSVLEVISKARDRFVLAKKVEVDMTKAIMLLNTSRDHLKLGKFEEAMRYAEESRKELDKSLETFYAARDQLVELAKAVKFASDLGADSTASRNSLAEARKLFEAKEYEETVEGAERGLAEVAKVVRERAMSEIEVADKSVKLGKQIGADMTEAEGTLQRALESMAKGEMLECVNLSKASREAANAAMTRVMSDKLQSLDQFVKGYSGDASTVTDIGELITEARQNIASYDFEHAHNILKEVTEKIESIGQDECRKVIGLAVERIEALKSISGDASDLEILLTRANDAFERRVYDDATARAREIIDHADETMARLVMTELSAVKDTLEEARTIGINIRDAMEALSEARTVSEAQSYLEAFRSIRRTKESLEQDIVKYDSVKTKLTRAEELISEAAKAKADVSHLSRKLETARERFAAYDLDRADEAVEDLVNGAEKSLAMYLTAKLILTSKESIELAQSHGIDVKETAGRLAEAKDLMRQKRYEDALVAAKASDQAARKTIADSITEMIRDVQRLVTDARNVGVDTVGPEKLLTKATDLARSADFVEALRCISSAREDINHVKSLSSQAAVEIRAARNGLKDAETLDMDVGRARELLEQAIEALTRHQYAIALELSRKSSEASLEVSRSRIWDILQKFKERVDKAAEEGVHVGMAERLVADGLQAFKDGKFQDSLKLAMACEAEMDRAELQRDMSSRAVELAKKKLAEAGTEGIGNEELTRIVERAEALLREGKYVEAMTTAIESGDELYSVKEKLDGCRIELSTTKERIDRLKKINIDTSECDEILEMAQELMSSQQFSKSSEAMTRASETAARLFESSIRDVMEQNRQIISKARSMGINTKRCEDLLEVANTSFTEKLWDFAYQQAMSCRESCLGLVSKKISNLVAEVMAKADELKRQGAATGTIEDMLEHAKRAADSGDIANAFQILMDADSRLVGLEESHKKYLDIMIAAESAIENIARFGLSKREPERLMDMAEIEKEKDYDSAIELVAAALDTAKEMLETCSADLSASIASAGLQEGAEGEMTLIVKNTGKALAKDLSIEVVGDFETGDAMRLAALKPGAEVPINVKLTPRKSGSVPIKVRLSSKRHLDGKIQTFELDDSVNVFASGPPFKIGRSAETTRCISCQGRIKPGFDIVTCRCGGQLHLSCAKRARLCPICGQKYQL